MPTTIAEKPVSGAARMRAENLEAEARAAVPVKPWTPTLPQQKPKPPAVQARLEEAAGMRAEGQELTAKADSLAVAANLLNQRLSALDIERTAILQRLTNIESRNFASEKAQAQDTFNRFYGVHALEHHQLTALNSAIIFLDTVAVTERLAPPLAKKLKIRVSEIDEEVANLTAGK